MRLIAKIAIPIGLVLSLVSNAQASTLWIGNDQNPADPIHETTTGGAVLRTLPGVGVGFAIDQAGNRLFVNDTFSSATVYNLTTLAVLGTVNWGFSSEDLSFDGTNLLVGDFFGHRVVRVNPGTGATISSVAVGFQPLGLTTDGGAGFWATNFAANGAVTHFNAAGVALSSFVPFPNDFAGGLGFDSSDSTLWIGTGGRVFHYTTAGGQIGSFSTGDSRFVDGLEVANGASAAPVPEPTSIMLLGSGVALLLRRRHRSRADADVRG